jgi:hypothetical protein
MAAWQFDMYLLPRASLASRGLHGGAIPEELFNNANWWQRFELQSDYQAQFSAMLPWSMPWSPEVQTWGFDGGNRIDVLLEGERPIEMRARLDVREPDLEFLRGLIAFAQANHLLFVTPDMRVIEPDFGHVWSAIASSGAMLFVRDPEAWLNRIGVDDSPEE